MPNNKFVLPFYYKDFNDSTQDWSDEEVGAYLRLLVYQWSQGLIPEDEKRLQRIAESYPNNKHIITQKFTQKISGGYQNPILEKIRVEQLEYHERQRNNGKKGGNPNFKKGVNNPYYGNKKDNPTNNPKDIPLKSVVEVEDKVIVKKVVKVNSEKIILPFAGETFKAKWKIWKQYRTEIKKPYKTDLSEQAALKMLSVHSEEIAIAMIENSIANQWQGLFEIKENKNGKQVNKPERVYTIEDFKD